MQPMSVTVVGYPINTDSDGNSVRDASYKFLIKELQVRKEQGFDRIVARDKFGCAVFVHALTPEDIYELQKDESIASIDELIEHFTEHCLPESES